MPGQFPVVKSSAIVCLSQTALCSVLCMTKKVNRMKMMGQVGTEERVTGRVWWNEAESEKACVG